MVAVTTAEPAAAGAPIALWAVPRSRSTAFLRVMTERGDLEVVHEPFSYLIEDGSFEVAGAVTTSMPQLLRELLRLNATGRRVFFNETSDYRYPALLEDDHLYSNVINTFMIRDPSASVASHYAMNPAMTIDEVGFEYLHHIFEKVRQAGEIPLVIDGGELAANPEAVLKAFCDRVGLDYHPEALHWQPGVNSAWQRTERWHRDVANSTGLTAKSGDHWDRPENNPHLRHLVEHRQPFLRRNVYPPSIVRCGLDRSARRAGYCWLSRSTATHGGNRGPAGKYREQGNKRACARPRHHSRHNQAVE